MRKQTGFTLAELLIVLAILGVIATFTIPKVLISQQDTKRNAIVKEALAAFSGAYQAYLIQNSVSGSTNVSNLTPYLNYIEFDTDGSLVDAAGSGTWDCTPWGPCIRLASGAVIHYDNTKTFGGTSSLNVIYIHVDVDGQDTQATGAPSDTVPIFLYTDGRLTDEGNILAGTLDSSGTYSPSSGNTPSWFKW